MQKKALNDVETAKNATANDWIGKLPLRTIAHADATLDMIERTTTITKTIIKTTITQ
jgi:hypothetical protein